MGKNAFLIGFLFSSLVSSVWAQNPRQIIDSLKLKTKSISEKEELANAYGELAWQYAAINLDSSIFYGKRSVELAESSGNPSVIAQAYTDLGSGLLQKGDLNSARDWYQKALTIRQEISDSLGLAKVYNALGFIYQRKYESDSAILYFLKALPIFEKFNSPLHVATIKNNLGVIYQGLPDYEKALKVYLEAATIREELGDTRGLIGSYINLGTVYKYLKKFDEAEPYFQNAIKIGEETGDLLNMAMAYRSYSVFLQEKGDMQLLEKISREGIEIAKEVNAQYEEAVLEMSLGVALKEQGRYSEAKKWLLSSANKFVSQGADEDVLVPYLELVPLYASLGLPDSSRYYSNLYQETLRNKYEKESRETTAELETKYQTALKDSQIAAQELEINKKNLLLFGSLALALVLVVVGYLLYKQQRLKNQQLQQESKLQAALAKIETQNKLQEQRELISRDLHDNIGAQLTFIISAIENLKFYQPIQEQLTHRFDQISNFTRQTITELRDTIWAMNSGEISWQELCNRVQAYTQKAVESSGISMEFHIGQSFPLENTMPSSQSIQILRIIQESIQNSIKHSEASEVKIVLEKNKGGISLQVSDNGKGFDLEKVIAGNGLYNLRKRAEELGAVLEINTSLGSGTKIKLTEVS
ncbi:tetratricopeptide repeat-containing sensor histidine kinase [Algoriphagus algorifonticola]|uniref:tetratricopeptide repeat-containing sensor histidine kinase n=1 Tax=Algoriphagus algorifonticola TaxID=2593007 RepID=UPI0011A8B426|nr:tetratricopeptide repeat protein [Algoriphagus algorifonticola]